MEDYQKFIAVSRYARWIDEKGRRETWEETVDRYVSYMSQKVKGHLPLVQIKDAITKLEVMPSMRALMTAGSALERDNTAGYNCSYLPVDDPKAFDEAMYILLCGTGVGFSVERQYVSQLPEIPQGLDHVDTCIQVQDSKEGWARALRKLIGHLYMGEVPVWDMSKVRPAGARLKVFGGRASGPAPLIDLFNFTVALFKQNEGKKLSSYDCHNLMCKVGEVVVSGGVRRSAMISLSNLSDQRMRHAKSGKWWETAPQMALSNNSVVYTEKPDGETFLREWTSLVESKSGERGIFNRLSAKDQASKYGRRDPNYDFGCNPCSEIILRPYQFCNLTEVVIREKDKFDDLKRKVMLATILGTAQATLTKFPYLRKIWNTNTEEERLLGVSLTGIMDNPLTNGKKHGLEKTLKALREVAVETNKEWSAIFGIPQSTAITCVKPSGTVSQLVDSSSGIHPRHSSYYIRTVRGDNKDPLTNFMIDSGIPSEADFMKPDTQTVFSFPMKSPKNSVMRNDMTAIEQLEMWLLYQRHWCEHKPSVTISVRDDEWMEVGAFVFKHFDEMSGVSFLPHSDHTYQQAPYQDCTEAVYNDFSSKFGHIDWDKFTDYEKEDNTKSSQTFACSGDSCEIVDIGA
ncbi:putative adenosylcobalamin-dependent ribonucleoside-triphosphate reductase [uncultured virus]|uniref:Putative adenosylcobalamin-dependent ribonucleoside-triphosphate reductase n=1 Tax=uncultured virus TaxID=340016 RepID=A0A218MLD5_9VIRU|nr:putative adenosylcobalamin-dependent ribonucleoside-triphosphate reductase [uncultured virus]